MTADELKEAVQHAFEEAFNRGNLDALDEVCAPALIDYSTAVAAGQVGLEGFKLRIASHRTGLPDLHMTMEDVSYDGDKLSYRWSFRGTQTGPWLGRPPSGKAVTVVGMNLERLAGGKIVEHYSYPDILGAMRQLDG